MESPAFFKTLALGGKFFLGAGGVIMAACLAAPELVSATVLEVTKTVASYMIFGGGIIAGVSQLTVSDYSELKEKLDEKDTN